MNGGIKKYVWLLQLLYMVLGAGFIILLSTGPHVMKLVDMYLTWQDIEVTDKSAYFAHISSLIFLPSFVLWFWGSMKLRVWYE